MSSTQIRQVIAHNNCIGCGACVFAAPQSFDIGLNYAGHYVATETGPAPEPSLAAICPMSGEGKNETQIAAELYPDLPQDKSIGRYRSTFAGHVTASDYRSRGGSGGLVSWLAAELLNRREVDAIMHVKPTESAAPDAPLFEFAFSETEDTVKAGAKSRYYPVTMAEVLPTLVASDKRFAVIGIPCFIKSIRLLQDAGTVSRDRIPYTIGLVCGHLKSRYFADYLAWQKGCRPGTLQTIDFRHKILGRHASRYGFAFRSGGTGSNDVVVTPMADVRGNDWGEGQFKNPACEFCDDVLAECADISVGDAWLPEYVVDYKGANIVVTRDATIDQIIRGAVEAGDLVMDEVTVDQVVQSQSSGLRHRREGLAHRLARRQSKGVWAPRKRVEPKIVRNPLRRWIYDLRLSIAERSAPAFAEVVARGGTLVDYERRMGPYLKGYKALSQGAARFKTLVKRLR